MTISEGIHPDMPLETYLADPCPEPSVSKGDLLRLYDSSPAHCWFEHPRLNPNCPHEDSKRADIGSAIHAKIMHEDRIVYGDYPDFRTKEARAWRDEIYEQGNVPILMKDKESIDGAAKAAHAHLQTYPLWGGEIQTEQTMIWQKDGIWKRGRFDLFCPAANLMVDIKTCTSANPTNWIRTSLFTGGYDFQAEHYMEGARQLGRCNSDSAWLFLLVELEPPHECVFIGMDPRAMEVTQLKIKTALSKWKRCMASNEWPGYGSIPYWAEVKDWQEADAHLQAMLEESNSVQPERKYSLL